PMSAPESKENSEWISLSETACENRCVKRSVSVPGLGTSTEGRLMMTAPSGAFGVGAGWGFSGSSDEARGGGAGGGRGGGGGRRRGLLRDQTAGEAER